MNFLIYLHENINTPLLQTLNSLTEIKYVGDFVYIFADAPIFLIPIFLVVYWIINRKNNDEKKKLLFIFYSTILAILISTIVQQFVSLDRPEESLKSASRLILDHIPDASFPSDHASVSIAFLTSLFLFWFKKVFWCFLPLFLIMNLSRVIWWVHWPFDVLAWSVVWVLSWMVIYNLKETKVFKAINEFILKITKFFGL